LHPSTNLLAATTPSSSTPASTAPSECSSSLTASQLKKVIVIIKIFSKLYPIGKNIIKAGNPSLKCHPNTQSTQRSSGNNVNANNLRKIPTANNNGGSTLKGGDGLLGRPNLVKGAGLMGARPHLASTAAMISQASILRRNDTSRNGAGLLPTPIQGKMNGLIVTGSNVQVWFQNFSGLYLKTSFKFLINI